MQPEKYTYILCISGKSWTLHVFRKAGGRFFVLYHSVRTILTRIDAV